MHILNGTTYSYHQLGTERFGINKGKLKWSVSLDYRRRSATFIIYTKTYEELTLEYVLEDLFLKTIVDSYDYENFCHELGYKVGKKSEKLYNEWVEIADKLNYLFEEDYDFYKQVI